MKKAAYKFESKHLGKAFMEELKDMGYYCSNPFDKTHKYILNPFDKDGGVEDVGFNQQDSLYKTEIYFQLETQWKEALEFAKEQIEKIEETIEVNGYEAEFKDGYVKFGCAEIDNQIFKNAQTFFDSAIGGNSNKYVTAIKIGEGLFDIETIEAINKRLK